MANSADQGSRLVTWGLAAMFGAVLAIGILVVAFALAVAWGIKGLVIVVIICALVAVIGVRAVKSRS
ncbi:MAG TPA: hypothetical protein VF426_07210 [Marmoricola sp.]